MAKGRLWSGTCAEEAVQLQVDTSEAEAILAILALLTAGEPVVEPDWERLFSSEPYRRLKQREAEMSGGFDDAQFQLYVQSDALLRRAEELEHTLASWKRADLEEAARNVLVYLPSQARICAKVFPVIKPLTNSFVFEMREDPTVFLYLDPALTSEQFENTVRHGNSFVDLLTRSHSS